VSVALDSRLCMIPERLERGCPPLTVETEANGDSESTYERGPSLVSSFGSSCRYKRFLSYLGCSCRLSAKYFFPHCTLFHFVCPHRPASWAGSCARSTVSYYSMCLCMIPIDYTHTDDCRIIWLHIQVYTLYKVHVFTLLCSLEP
jgi:hypothetical protein